MNNFTAFTFWLHEGVRCVRRFYFLFPYALFPLFPAVAFAQIRIANPAARYDTLCEFLLFLLDVFLLVVIPLLTVSIIYGGFLMVTSAGDETRLKSGKSWVLWSLVGGAVILGAFLIYEVIAGTWALFGDGSPTDNLCVRAEG